MDSTMSEEDAPPVERYYTYAEAAEILRVSLRTVREYVYQEQVPRYQHVCKNRRVRYIGESIVRQWLKRQLVCRTPNRTMASESPTA
jgi:hypothetical protein